ncbi:lactonase family protein [Flammeovirgaceae bacterium SG7u.111]|nr:lactonase family protein [Flammeovirgaceae bacterium SG7u.132]WPO33336.1 lactonase family protein [Flammeovirgaceae bacterium SG7u.111]
MSIQEAKSQDDLQKTLLYVGTYSVRGSEGIYVYNFDDETGAFSLLQTVGGVVSPSFIELHPNGKFLYSVNRGGVIPNKKWGSISAFTINPSSGELYALNKQTSNGEGPCHVAVDPDGDYVYVGNYVSGNLVMYPIKDDGSIRVSSDMVQHEGSGANEKRQEGPHVHSVNPSPDGKFIYVPDLGINKIKTYAPNKVDGKLGEAKSEAVAASGAGPRHFTIHPSGKFAYSAEELTSTVGVFAVDEEKGKLTSIQENVSSLPADFKGESYSADIHVHPNGKFLYVSNRGHNSVAIFKIAEETGKLELLKTESVLGNWPRNFMVTPNGKFLLCANERSDNIVIYTINQETGMLSPLDKQIKMPSPVCLKMLHLE